MLNSVLWVKAAFAAETGAFPDVRSGRWTFLRLRSHLRCNKYDEFLGDARDQTAKSISHSPEFTAGTTIESTKIVLTSYGTIRRCP
jgi:hypothetical protein